MFIFKKFKYRSLKRNNINKSLILYYSSMITRRFKYYLILLNNKKYFFKLIFLWVHSYALNYNLWNFFYSIRLTNYTFHFTSKFLTLNKNFKVINNETYKQMFFIISSFQPKFVYYLNYIPNFILYIRLRFNFNLFYLNTLLIKFWKNIYKKKFNTFINKIKITNWTRFILFIPIQKILNKKNLNYFTVNVNTYNHTIKFLYILLIYKNILLRLN